MTINITINGGLTAAPEIRYSAQGVAIASFTVASTERYKKGEEWVDGKRLFLRCSAFRDIAENIGQSRLEKGQQVSVTGKLHTREWEQDGQKRSGVELDVTDFAVSIKRATVQVTRAQGQQAGQGARTAPSTHQAPQPASDGIGDVWGAPASFPQDMPF